MPKESVSPDKIDALVGKLPLPLTLKSRKRRSRLLEN